MMTGISRVRLYLLRGGFLLIAVGLTLMIGPGLLWAGENVPHMSGVVRSMLGAVCLLSYVGIFFPLKMVPVMFFELVWKTIWLIVFGLPLWRAGRLDADTGNTMFNCIFGIVVVLIVVPWGYIRRELVQQSGEAWNGQAKA